MKILMTGATRLQRLAPEHRAARSTDIAKIDVPAAVRDALVRLGHDVTWRPVQIGEDLSGFDAIWCSISSPLSPNATAGVAGGMYWTHSRLDIPIVTFYDDWKSTRLGHSNTKSLLKNPEHFLTRVLIGPKDLRGPDVPATWSGRDASARAWEAVHVRRVELQETRPEFSPARVNQLTAQDFYPDRDDIIKHYDEIIAGAEAVQYGRPNQVRVVPMYSWGDPETVWPHLGATLAKSMPLVLSLDPSYVTEEIIASAKPRLVLPEIREHAWALALLSKPSDLLKTIPPAAAPVLWPINTIGHRETGMRLDTEVDVLAWTSAHSGVLSLPYYGGRRVTPLKGWWRSRYLYGAAARVPVATAMGEADALGEAYRCTPREIEEMTYIRRLELAEAQADALRPRYTHRREFDQQVALALTVAAGD